MNKLTTNVSLSLRDELHARPYIKLGNNLRTFHFAYLIKDNDEKNAWNYLSKYLKKLNSLNKIDPSVLLNLNKFINSIKYNVGVRQQPKLNRDLALYAATCNADHKDLSIHF